MKKITNKAIVLLFIIALSSTFLVNADDNTNDSTDSIENTATWTQIPTFKKGMWNIIIEAKNNFKEAREQRKENRETFMKTQQEKRDEAKLNREEFKNNKTSIINAFSGITDTQKEELTKLRDEHKTAIEDIMEKLKNRELTLEERETLRLEIEKINEKFNEEVKNLFSDNEKVLVFIETKEKLKLKNEKLRDEAKIAREQYREGRDEQIMIQKEFYLNKLALTIPKVNDIKLENISKQAQKMLEKIEANTKLSTEKKDKISSKIISLIEILEEEIENRAANSEEIIDIEEILTEE